MKRALPTTFLALGIALLCTVTAQFAVGETFIYYEDEMAISSNPIHERSMSEVRLNELIHIALWAPNYADQPQPMLVQEATLASSGREMTIKLKDVKWSDGQPVTAEDVVFTLQAYKNPESRSADRNRWDFIIKAEAVDARTVNLTFKRTYREPPAAQLYLKIIPKHVFRDSGVPRNHSYRTSPVVAGGMVVKEKDHKNWILQRYAGATRAPKLDEVRCQEVPEKRTQAELMSYEYGHAMIEVEPVQRAELEADQCCTLKPYPSKSWWYTAFNQKVAALGDVKVRRAMSLAIDRAQALKLIGEGELISGPFTLSSRYYNHDVPVPTKNIEEASRLMTEAGYSKSGAQWTKSGKAVSLRFFYDEAMGDNGQTVATNIVGQLKTFGIDVSDPVALGGELWEERVMQKQDFDLVMGVWSFDVNEDIGQLFSRSGPRNFVSYVDPRTDDLLDGAHKSQDPSEQQAFMKEIHKRLAVTQPYIFQWSLRNFSAISWDVTGSHIQAYYYFTQFPDWDVKKD
ncbi:MAG: ABC transporter substrate-binding protein [Myxococcota bacterium]|nr:ABC transporter substrate-binding protein [Myxococcota bacterium]